MHRKKNFTDFIMENDKPLTQMINNLLDREDGRGIPTMTKEFIIRGRNLLNDYLMDPVKRRNIVIVADIGSNLYQFAHLSLYVAVYIYVK
jgi:hypothetical protein